MRKIKTAMIGCGMISNIYAKNMTSLFSVTDLVAVCDVNEAAAKEKAEKYGAKAMTMEEVCDSDEIELVVNLTGPAVHYDIVKKLLLAGKHVYTEKVLCFDLEQGKELVQIANERNLQLAVAPDTILGAGVQTARKMLDAGMIGTPTSCVAVMNRNQALASETFRFIRSAGGSFPYDVGVYYVAGLLNLFGPVKRLSGLTKPAPLHKGRYLFNEDYGQEWELIGSNLQSGTLEFENGVVGTLHFDGTSMNDMRPYVAIYGTEGILYLDGMGDFGNKVRLKRIGAEEIEVPFTHGFAGEVHYGEPEWFDAYGHRGVGVADLAWGIVNGRPARCSKELGLHTLEVLTGLDVSSETEKVYKMTTTFDRPAAIPSGYLEKDMDGAFRADAEYALTL